LKSRLAVDSVLKGFRVDNETTLNTANFLYRTRTNGKDYDVAFKDMSGYSQVTDLRIDVAPDFTAPKRVRAGVHFDRFGVPGFWQSRHR